MSNHARETIVEQHAIRLADVMDGFVGKPVGERRRVRARTENLDLQIVRDDAPWLVELARAIAATLSRPSHEVTVKPVPPGEIARLRVPRTIAGG